jgi:hypothetical protein
MSEPSAVETQDETEVVSYANGTIGAIIKSETESQLEAAHHYPRQLKRFLNEAITLATYSVEIAESCMYSLPRAGKAITGPSVRLAEMVASAYGNLHVGARVVGVEDKEIIAQGVAWDLEKNIRVTIEKRRRITKKDGRRFDDDMITVTGNAAASIGLRDAIFRVIPRAYVMTVYEAARKVAVGDASTLADKRKLVMERLQKMGATPDRILARIEKAAIEDIGLTELEVLIGLGTAIKDGGTTVDDAFPVVQQLNTDKGKSAIDRIVENSKKPKESKESAASNKAQAGVDDKGPDSPAQAADTCERSDFELLEILGTENGVGPKKWRKHIEATMGFSVWEFLTKARLPEVQAWIRATGKHE